MGSGLRFGALLLIGCHLTCADLFWRGNTFAGSFTPRPVSSKLAAGICRWKPHGERQQIAMKRCSSLSPSAKGNSTRRRRWSWNLFAWWAIVLLCGPNGLYSAAIGLLALKPLMRRMPVQTKRGSMACFAWRGATIGVLLSILLELFLPLSLFKLFPALAVFLKASGALGGVEEFTKFLALIWLSWSGKNPFRRKFPPAKVWPQSKRGLMLAGFCLGVGFMVVENAGYFAVHAAIDPENIYDLEMFVFRIFFNPHPFLTGIAAGRFAKIASDVPPGVRLTPGLLLKVLWPSALLHALSNLAAGPRVRFSCFLVCLKVFLDTWKSLDEPADRQPDQAA